MGEISQQHCLHCGHRWYPRPKTTEGGSPVRCPNCGKLDYDVPKGAPETDKPGWLGAQLVRRLRAVNVDPAQLLDWLMGGPDEVDLVRLRYESSYYERDRKLVPPDGSKKTPKRKAG